MFTGTNELRITVCPMIIKTEVYRERLVQTMQNIFRARLL